MIRHIVFFHFHDGATKDEVDAIDRSLADLQGIIPGIIEFCSGENMSALGLNMKFTYGFTMDFESVQARDDYEQHPEHQAVVQKKITPLLADGLNSTLVFDFEND